MTYYSGKDLGRSFLTVRKNTIQVANDIPEEQYGFRATPDTRTVMEHLQHVAARSVWMKKMYGDDRKRSVSFEDFGTYTREANEQTAQLTTKAAIVDALTTRGNVFSAWLESLDEAAFAEMISFQDPVRNPSKSLFEVLLGAKEHEMHHRGQLMLMERLLGIVPHLTRARQGR